jgi:iron-sulfur cluster assembly accessory protein
MSQMRQIPRLLAMSRSKYICFQQSLFGTQRASHQAASAEEGTMIQLTEAAAGALHSAIATVPRSIAGLRLMVRSGGCAGLQYEMGLVEHSAPEDISYESHGVKILIDPSSLALISGTTIDFIDSQEGTGFSFDNPHAQSKGGCGKSCF